MVYKSTIFLGYQGGIVAFSSSFLLNILRYGGVIMDEILNWDEHIRFVAKKKLSPDVDVLTNLCPRIPTHIFNFPPTCKW